MISTPLHNIFCQLIWYAKLIIAHLIIAKSIATNPELQHVISYS